jgi:5-methylcytosine-specific restriction endonuclease McrA
MESKKAKPLNNKERRRRKEKLVAMLGGKCVKCGYKKSIAALSFHHLNPKEKSFDLSHNGNLLHSWEEVVVEALKCQILCLNCHAEFHSK